MTISIMVNNRFRFLRSLMVAAFWLIVWSVICWLANRNLLLALPYPWDVASALWRLIGESRFWFVVGISLMRVIVGFVSAALFGVLLAMLTTRFEIAHALISPILSIVRAAPVASFIFVAFLWIRSENMPVFIAFLMVLPLVWENVRQGVIQTDTKLLEMAQVFQLNRYQRFWHIRLPAVRPYLRSALTTGFGFAWKAGIAAEILCWPSNSIGYHIAAAKNLVETAEVFAWTTVVVAFSVFLEWGMRRLMDRQEVL